MAQDQEVAAVHSRQQEVMGNDDNHDRRTASRDRATRATASGGRRSTAGGPFGVPVPTFAVKVDDGRHVGVDPNEIH